METWEERMARHDHAGHILPHSRIGRNNSGASLTDSRRLLGWNHNPSILGWYILPPHFRRCSTIYRRPLRHLWPSRTLRSITHPFHYFQHHLWSRQILHQPPGRESHSGYWWRRYHYACPNHLWGHCSLATTTSLFLPRSLPHGRSEPSLGQSSAAASWKRQPGGGVSI